MRQLDYIRKVGWGGGHMPEKKSLTLYPGFPSHHPLANATLAKIEPTILNSDMQSSKKRKILELELCVVSVNKS